ncbi:MAG: sensor histidine kinase, partial [Lysobacter sp.]
MIRSLFFATRLAAAWFGLFVMLALFASAMPVLNHQDQGPLFALGVIVSCAVAITAFSHLRRVRLIAGRIDANTIANRQRRQIDVPLDADETFNLLDAVIRELPRTRDIESARDSLQVRAKVDNPGAATAASASGAATGNAQSSGPVNLYNWWMSVTRNQLLATVESDGSASRVTLICEPESGAWSDWFRVDHATNLENAEAIVRAINRRIAERHRNERADAARTSTEKELAVAKLSLLHAQVEPHFLYNTLA